MREKCRVWVHIPVRWGDMDAYAHVNNAAFFTYFEEARLAYFEAIQVFEHAEAPSHKPILATATINYRRQVAHPADLLCGLRAVKLGYTSFTLEHFLIREGPEELIADGSSVVVLADYDTGRPVPLPDGLRKAIAALDGPEDNRTAATGSG